MLSKITNFLNGKIFQSGLIETNKISFSEEVVGYCRVNHCGRYNQSWMCPPAIGNLKELKTKYTKFKNAFVFTKIYTLEDSYDLESMDRGREDINQTLQELKKYLGEEEFQMLGVGSCSLCVKCVYPKHPCIKPNLAIPSIEAVGIDVVELAKQCNINYYNGINTVTYFACIMFD